MEAHVKRAVLWHQGRLGASESLFYYDLHVLGPQLHGGAVNPTRFHTYACLFPEQGQYVAMNTNDWPGCSIDALSLRNIIANHTVDSFKQRQLDDIATEYVGPLTSPQERWDAAVAMATLFRLPVAFYIVGNTLATNQRVVYLRAVAIAPIDTVIAEFTRAVPASKLN